MATKEQVIEAAKLCFDPEIPVNIWDLGLIYEINVNAETDSVDVKMSLTAKHCPAAQSIPENFKQKITEVCNPKSVNVEVVFEPAWTPERISAEGKKKLGLNES